MPSYLGHYKGAASNRKEKFVRAVKSFISQDYQDKVLIVVSDGCRITQSLTPKFENVKLVNMPKQPTFSGSVRKKGVMVAKQLGADIITYLDTDDFLEFTHLTSIANAFLQNDCDWIYCNDKLADKERVAVLDRSKIGTSNISHRSDVPIIWGHGYCHDWKAIESIMNYKSFKAEFSSYVVCHIPNQLDI